jgi:hypothetical protein
LQEGIKMKMGRVIVIVLFSMLIAATSCFAANEFQLNGTISTINGNVITITDNKGKQINLEGSSSDFKAGDRVVLKVQMLKPEALRTGLTSQDFEFLTKQCLIDQADVDVIPQLTQEGKGPIFSAINNKDCKQLAPFKASREYFKQLKPKTKLPMPPNGWDTNYLTDKEFEQYTEIIADAPW